jgi:segregation and condensation protein B
MDTPSASDVPSLMQVLGAMLYGARAPLSAADLRRVLLRVAANAESDGPEKAFAKVKESEVRKALDALRDHLDQAGLGIRLGEVADGFRYQTDLRCGPWVRDLLDLGKPARLSRPALETLAIIAYRQPITRAEIEAVRGVAVDAMVRTLLEGGLVRIVARSELPGRPLLYGTTQQFLEHFGLKSVNDLPGIEQLARRDAEWAARQPAAEGAAEGATPPPDGTAPTPDTAADAAPPAASEPTDAGVPAGEHDAATSHPTPGGTEDEDEVVEDDETDEDDERDDDDEDDDEEEDDVEEDDEDDDEGDEEIEDDLDEDDEDEEDEDQDEDDDEDEDGAEPDRSEHQA